MRFIQRGNSFFLSHPIKKEIQTFVHTFFANPFSMACNAASANRRIKALSPGNGRVLTVPTLSLDLLQQEWPKYHCLDGPEDR
jgi:hypothetical protein